MTIGKYIVDIIDSKFNIFEIDGEIYIGDKSDDVVVALLMKDTISIRHHSDDYGYYEVNDEFICIKCYYKILGDFHPSCYGEIKIDSTGELFCGKCLSNIHLKDACGCPPLFIDLSNSYISDLIKRSTINKEYDDLRSSDIKFFIRPSIIAELRHRCTSTQYSQLELFNDESYICYGCAEVVNIKNKVDAR